MIVVLKTAKPREDPLASIKTKIHIWANWYRVSAEGGLPPHSLEGRAILRGGAAPRPQDAAHGLPSNAVAEQVEAGLCRMHIELRRTITLWHIERLPVREAARVAGCSVAGFKERRRRAYSWLDGHLAGNGLDRRGI